MSNGTEAQKNPASGRYTLDAKTVVENYLKARAGIAQVNADMDAKEAGVKAEIGLQQDEYRKKQQELSNDSYRALKALNNNLVSVQNTRKNYLEPYEADVKHAQRIIAILRMAEGMTPAPEVEDGEITAFHGEYLELLGYLYDDEGLKIRLLITENRKPKNRYSLIAYGYCSFRDEELLKCRNRVYTYGTPNLNDNRETYQVRLDLGSFPSVEEAKKYAEHPRNTVMKAFIAEYQALKAEYLEVVGKYSLSDFEAITRDEKEGSK